MLSERGLAKIAVMVSGGGTNLQALIDAEAAGIIHSGKISLVLSNKADAYALERARRAGIPTAVVERRGCADKAEFEQKIIDALDGVGIDIIVLAGFMCIDRKSVV